jgi:hypothetical protein
MTWAPGLPVKTSADMAEWRQWRKDRKRDQQRQRRAVKHRIDYYPDTDAMTLIEGLWRPTVGHDLSSVINGIIAEWADLKKARKGRAAVPPK